MSHTPVRHAFLSAAALVFTFAGLARAQPANNLCANAIVVNPGDTVAGTTVGATNDGSADCASSNTSPDVWYKILVPGTGTIQLDVDLCQPTGGYDTALSVHTGCPGVIANQIACDDDACGNLKSLISVTINKGSTYYIRVNGFAGNTGAFTLHVSTSVPPPPPPPPAPGPDVTTSTVTDMTRYGPANSPVTNVGTVSVYAYGIGTESCNRGDAPCMWIDSGSRQGEHPVIAQNLYRLKNGRFEQIGISWLKHSFLATNDQGCGSCPAFTPPPGYSSGDALGPACSDIYSAGLNDSQGNGPRFEVNGTTAVFPFPHSNPAAPGGTTAVSRRCQVKVTDVDPAANAGARYFAEGHYFTADDIAWNNGLNSMSYREVSGLGSAGFAYNFVGATVQRSAAIYAWQAADAGVVIVPVDYTVPITYQSVTRDVTCRFLVGARATGPSAGLYHYEYTIYNINSDRAGQAFAAKVNPAFAVSNIGFSTPFYHSGEPCNNAPWTGQGPTAAGAMGYISWQTGLFANNTATDNATNALRWSTAYSYRFDSTGAPANRSARFRLFKPGAPMVIKTPPIPLPPAPCPADIANSTGGYGPDGFVTGIDFDAFIQAYYTAATDPFGDLVADITDGTGTGDPDGFLTGTDFDSYTIHFFNGC